MALFTETQLRNRVENQISKSLQSGPLYESFESKAKNILNEWVNEQKTFTGAVKTYDIFLSHSSNDAALVAGLKLELEDLGYSIYVDWIEDPKLSRANVTKETALVLQSRMKQCQALIYAFSENASNSKWMPWELGYFDGIKGTVAVLPIAKSRKNSFQGSEYLGIYYYIEIDIIRDTNKTILWVCEASNLYISYEEWLKGKKPYIHV